jgi:hypothetical protein
MRAFLTLVLAVTLALVMPARCADGKGSLKIADLPAAVRKTVLQQKQQAKITQLEKTSLGGEEAYEVQFTHGASRRTVFIAGTGTVLQVKENISLSKVSLAARKAIESSVGNGTIVTLEAVKSASGLIAAYEVKFRKNGTQSELRISPDGRLAPE